MPLVLWILWNCGSTVPTALRLLRHRIKTDGRTDGTSVLTTCLPNRVRLNPRDVAHVEIDDRGSALHWPTLDVDHYVPGLIDGIFGTRKWMARIGMTGGAASTPAKREAARKNGKKAAAHERIRWRKSKPAPAGHSDLPDRGASRQRSRARAARRGRQSSPEDHAAAARWSRRS